MRDEGRARWSILRKPFLRPLMSMRPSRLTSRVRHSCSTRASGGPDISPVISLRAAEERGPDEHHHHRRWRAVTGSKQFGERRHSLSFGDGLFFFSFRVNAAKKRAGSVYRMMLFCALWLLKRAGQVGSRYVRYQNSKSNGICF